MGHYIVKLGDHYFEYSTVVDAPITFGMKLDEFKDYYRREYGEMGMRNLEQRLKRVELYGTSSLQTDHSTPDVVMRSNRAGPDESNLTIDEIHKAYCLRVPIRDGWLVPSV